MSHRKTTILKSQKQRGVSIVVSITQGVLFISPPPLQPKFFFHRGNKFQKNPKIFRLRRAKTSKFSACGGHNSIKTFPPAARSKVPKIFRLRRAEKHQNFSVCSGHKSLENFPLTAGSKVPKIFHLRRAEKPQKFAAYCGQ